MGFQLEHASKNAKLVPRPNKPPVVKDMVIKNGRFAKANAAAPTTPKTSTSIGGTRRQFTSRFARRARLSTSPAGLQSARTALPIVCEPPGATTAPGKANTVDMQEQDDEPTHDLPLAASSSKPFSGASAYIDTIKKNAVAGLLRAKGTPWFRAPNPFSDVLSNSAQRHDSCGININENVLRDAILRPNVFLWAPDLMYSGVDVRCPTCEHQAHFKEWGPVRILHTLSEQHAYVSARYTCSVCRPAKSSDFKRFMADCPAALKLLPANTQFDYDIAGTTGLLCDKRLRTTPKQCLRNLIGLQPRTP